MDGYCTIRETAQRWDVSVRRVQILCSEGRIEGAEKMGRQWLVPDTAAKPSDRRVTNGRYTNWRERYSGNE